MAFSFCGMTVKPAPGLSAESAVLLHEGRALYEKNASRRMPMASTTKIMTAIIAIENASVDELVKIRDEHCLVEGSSMYLRPDTEITVIELLKGLLLVSGNDAALALAEHVAGDVDSFTKLMNKKARALGLKNTHFKNPHGLSHPEHYTTAFDLAVLMEYCMKNELFREIVAMKSFESDGAELANHNRLLSCCPGCVGGKTGYTMASGRCLVSCCEREGAQLVCVTLSAPDDWNDHMALYDWAYGCHSMRSVTDGVRFTVPIFSDSGDTACLEPEEDKAIFIKDDAEIVLKAELPWFAFKPVEKGSIGGRMSIFVDGNRAGEYYLIYSDNYFQ